MIRVSQKSNKSITVSLESNKDYHKKVARVSQEIITMLSQESTKNKSM